MRRLLKDPFIVVFVLFVCVLITGQVVLGIILKPYLERQMRFILRTPVHIDQAGANILSGSIWMKNLRIKNAPGYESRDFLNAKKFLIDVNFLSLLTSEFALDQVRLEEPVFNFEIGKDGISNLTYFREQSRKWGHKFFRKSKRAVRLITSYRLDKFNIRNGRVYMDDERAQDSKRSFRIPSFALARLSYPPELEDTLPSTIYLNLAGDGGTGAKLIVIGKFNPSITKQNFEVTTSVQNLSFEEYRDWLMDLPVDISGGLLHLKTKAICRDNILEADNYIKVESVRLNSPVLAEKTKKIPGFGLAPKTMVKFFNQTKSFSDPIEFNFRVAGDLSNPDFDPFNEIKSYLKDELARQAEERMKTVSQKTKKIL